MYALPSSRKESPSTTHKTSYETTEPCRYGLVHDNQLTQKLIICAHPFARAIHQTQQSSVCSLSNVLKTQRFLVSRLLKSHLANMKHVSRIISHDLILLLQLFHTSFELVLGKRCLAVYQSSIYNFQQLCAWQGLHALSRERASNESGQCAQSARRNSPFAQLCVCTTSF